MPTVVVSFISNIGPYRPSHTVSSPLCFLYSQGIVYKEIGYKDMLLKIDYDFKKTTTTHCSVPMLKHPSDKAGPSH